MHVLKHTRAIDLSELDLDLDDVQFWLGHKNIANTMKYLAYTTTLKRKLFMQLSLLEGCKYESRFLNDKMYNRIKSHNVSEIHYKN